MIKYLLLLLILMSIISCKKIEDKNQVKSSVKETPKAIYVSNDYQYNRIVNNIIYKYIVPETSHEDLLLGINSNIGLREYSEKTQSLLKLNQITNIDIINKKFFQKHSIEYPESGFFNKDEYLYKLISKEVNVEDYFVITPSFSDDKLYLISLEFDALSIYKHTLLYFSTYEDLLTKRYGQPKVFLNETSAEGETKKSFWIFGSKYIELEEYVLRKSRLFLTIRYGDVLYRKSKLNNQKNVENSEKKQREIDSLQHESEITSREKEL